MRCQPVLKGLSRSSNGLHPSLHYFGDVPGALGEGSHAAWDRFKMFSRKGSPKGAYGIHTGGVSSGHIERRISHKSCTARIDPKTLQRHKNRLRVGFVFGRVVAPDDALETVVDPGAAEAATSQSVQLARYDADLKAGRSQIVQRLAHPLIRPR